MTRTLPFLTVLFASATALFAADEQSAPAARPAQGRRASVADIDRSAVGFAREHHPELADLLDRLRKLNPRAYRAAIQDLWKDRQRLERLRERAPERYDFELQLWTMDSQIRLLAARAAKGDVAEIRPQLQEMMQKRQQFRLRRLRQEQERVARRLQRVESAIADLEANPPSEADIDALLSRVKSRRQTAGQNARPADPAQSSADGSQSTSVDTESPTESPQE